MTPSDAATVGFRHFHDQLAHLKQRLLDMSDLATSLLDLSVDALLSRDANLAEAVLAGDHEIDALEIEVEDQAIGLLALQQPMARDLRFIIAAIKVSNYVYQTSQLAQTTLRTVLGEVELDELLSLRDKLNLRIQSIMDQRTEPVGVKVVSVEVKQVDLPEQMQRAMAKQAEAERERRSKIIHAEGEYSAAQRLVDAAKLLAEQPITLQLRYLQTLTEIGVEKNTTIVFPLPVELLSLLNKLGPEAASAAPPSAEPPISQ